MYEGEFVGGKKTGKGVKTWATGDIYDGDWKEAQKIAPPFLTHYFCLCLSQPLLPYSQDKRHGFGMLVRSCGTRYAGNFDRERRHGQGLMAWPNGSRFEGHFHYDQVTQGVYSWMDKEAPQGRTWVWPTPVRHGTGAIVVGGRVYTATYDNGRELSRVPGAPDPKTIELPHVYDPTN